jgi:hypothetical protein
MLSQRDKTWAEFSTLDVGVLAYAMKLHTKQKQPDLRLKVENSAQNNF